jgi:hydroxyacylglutathione hydrolase
MEEQFYIRQLKAGVDFGKDNQIAGQMANFIYLVGDRLKKECLVVDPAWDIQGVIDCAKMDGMTITGALCTHFHPDHVGGDLFGHHVQGLAELIELNPCKVHCHVEDIPYVKMMTGISDSDFSATRSGDVVKAGDVEIECLHTPGHTPGSQCFRCRQALIAGDTLFLQGCGRTDLPGGDPAEMRRTLTQRLATLPGDLILYPGHHYSPAKSAPMEEVRRTNPVLR